jgi:histidinol dehydrogenase
MVIADETADPAHIAAALIAQAEHGSGKEKIYLIFTKEVNFENIVNEINNQIPKLSHSESILNIFQKGFLAILSEDLEDVVRIANFIAPEHLELQVKDENLPYLQKEISTAGALLLGHYSATALGDFVAGPSHVLPTGRSSRFSSGLRIEDFFRRTSIIQYDEVSLQKASGAALLFSDMEKLDGHGNSISIRLKQD